MQTAVAPEDKMETIIAPEEPEKFKSSKRLLAAFISIAFVNPATTLNATIVSVRL